MRLILTEGSDQATWTPRLQTRRHDEAYAILSHRWREDGNCEVLFADIQEIDTTVTGPIRNAQHAGVDPREKAAFPKLQGAARQALADGYKYIWIDTCCIDKASSAELSEAINSMFNWYKSAAVCYVYLADCDETNVSTESGLTQFKASQWWTRCWTLQELLAPRNLIFYGKTWELIGTKTDLSIARVISAITNIDVNMVNGCLPLENASVAQRMSWAAPRKSSRIEDVAYSLIGLFAVNMSLLYGEGEKSFIRLQQEIMRNSDDDSILAWNYPNLPVRPLLLASHPSDFAQSHNIIRLHKTFNREPFELTSVGLSLSLPIVEVAASYHLAWLHCIESGTGQRMKIYLVKLTSSGAPKDLPARYLRIGFMPYDVETTGLKPSYERICIERRTDMWRNIGIEDASKHLMLYQILPTLEHRELKLCRVFTHLNKAQYTLLSCKNDPSSGRATANISNKLLPIPLPVWEYLYCESRKGSCTLYWFASQPCMRGFWGTLTPEILAAATHVVEL